MQFTTVVGSDFKKLIRSRYELKTFDTCLENKMHKEVPLSLMTTPDRVVKPKGFVFKIREREIMALLGGKTECMRDRKLYPLALRAVYSSCIIGRKKSRFPGGEKLNLKI